MALRNFISTIRDKVSGKRRMDKARARAAAAVPDAGIAAVANQQPAVQQFAQVPAMQTPAMQTPAMQTPAMQAPAAQAPPVQPQPRPRILTLPNELLNIIWRLALVENNWITIDERFREPGILQTCSEIRERTRMIWWYRNNFVLPIYNADGALYRAFSRRELERISHGDHPIGYYYDFVDQTGKEWSRLMEWCALTHHGDGKFAPLPWDHLDCGRPLPTVVKTALFIARDMRYLPWPICQTVLASYRRIAGMVDPEWYINR